MNNFQYISLPSKIIFGSGAISKTAAEIEALGCKKAFLLSTPFQADDVNKLAHQLDNKRAGVFNNATMHTPTDVTEKALHELENIKADCIVAYGGGSTTGLAKAIAWRTDLPQIIIPTSYAGSEVTPILGQTENGIKTTIKDPKILPEVVIYDPDLTMSLPPKMTMTSGLNAIAHAAEALYAQDRNPVSSLMAIDGIQAMIRSLPIIQGDPQNVEAREDALYGTWLCGTVLGSVGMALHHKLCHVIGGTFDLPHAETHAVILPHAVAFNAAAVPELLRPIADALQTDKPGLGLYNFAKSLNAPTTLKELGMPEDGIDRAAEIVIANPYWNPREMEPKLVRRLIEKAYHGIPPVR